MSDDVSLSLAIEAERERRRRKVRAENAHKYDFYGDECGCRCGDGNTCTACRRAGRGGCGSGLALGECKRHYRARENQRPPGVHRAIVPWDARGNLLPRAGRRGWSTLLVEAGRGFGKTFCGAAAVTGKVDSRQWHRIALVNETVKDVRTVMIEGSGGLLELCPPWLRCEYEPSKATVTWYTDRGEELAVATIYSAEEPGQLRGPQFDGAWPDELAKWKHRQQETWDMLQFGMRLGDHPQVIVTTTPRPTETYLAIRKDPGTVIIGGETKDNAAQLAPSFITSIYRKYEGTRLGEQELRAGLLLDTPGALWTTAILDDTRQDADLIAADDRGHRVPKGVRLVRVVVAVDPSTAAMADPESQAECGIVVVARGSDGHGYTLDDRSMKGTPAQWAEAVLQAYQDWAADLIVAEKNNGGAMVEQTIRNARLGGRPAGENAPIKLVWASRGKQTRAEPVSMLYEQRRIHHVGQQAGLARLEAQMTTWVPDEGDSPDRVDALVWGYHETMVEFHDQGGPKAGGRVRRSADAIAIPTLPPPW